MSAFTDQRPGGAGSAIGEPDPCPCRCKAPPPVCPVCGATAEDAGCRHDDPHEAVLTLLQENARLKAQLARRAGGEP